MYSSMKRQKVLFCFHVFQRYRSSDYPFAVAWSKCSYRSALMPRIINCKKHCVKWSVVGHSRNSRFFNFFLMDWLVLIFYQNRSDFCGTKITTWCSFKDAGTHVIKTVSFQDFHFSLPYSWLLYCPCFTIVPLIFQQNFGSCWRTVKHSTHEA